MEIGIIVILLLIGVSIFFSKRQSKYESLNTIEKISFCCTCRLRHWGDFENDMTTIEVLITKLENRNDMPIDDIAKFVSERILTQKNAEKRKKIQYWAREYYRSFSASKRALEDKLVESTKRHLNKSELVSAAEISNYWGKNGWSHEIM